MFGKAGGNGRRTLIGSAASAGLALVATLAFAAPVSATPVASNDGQYTAQGRVFPDPLAGCQNAGTSPCSPNAQGNTAATQFIQFTEFLDAIEYMNTSAAHPEWQRYLEVQVLDGALGLNGDGQGPLDEDLGIGDPGSEVFPGNNLPLEYDPKPEYRSVGLPRPTLARQKSDLVVLRVTDESVPDAGKERYALSLSIHGIERAGVEGGTRAMEDLVTAATAERSDQPIVPLAGEAEFEDPELADAPTFAETLRESIVYFTYPNPDGWRRGSVADTELGPGVFFQRYNGNGVDLNRDWPDIGYSFRPYSGLSEPETRGLAGYLEDVKSSTGDDFAAGDDLHGQPFADALSYTLLPHGRHDFNKDQRIRQTATAIHRASEQALAWSPIIQPNDAPQGGGTPCVPGPLGTTCAQIYGQTWGTVYDTINYTTTGALGDYFDSSVGLGADGIDNEMSFSHLDKNIVFDPHTEQLHVDGNKVLIFAHLAELLKPRIYSFDPAGTQGFVANRRLSRAEQTTQPGPPAGTVAQTDISGDLGTPSGTSTEFPFTVKRGPQPASDPDDGGSDIFNGGMRVDITKGNVQGVGDGGLTALKVQCRGCDRHVGVTDDDDWVTVAEDFNQSPIYLQAGLTASVNSPQALKPDGTPVEWRALLDGVQAAEMNVDFTRAPASTSGNTGGDQAPVLAGYDIANTDFFRELNGYIPDPAERFQEVDPQAVIDGQQSLDGVGSLTLADNPLPGFTGLYEGETEPGPPTDDLGPADGFESMRPTTAGQGADQCIRNETTTERFEFTIAPDDGNASMIVEITWGLETSDYDLFVLRKRGDDDEREVGSSAGFVGTSESVTVESPAAGDYIVEVVNCSGTAGSGDPWSGTVTFEPLPPAGERPPSDFTVAQKDAWFDALRGYVEAGGNLVLTDGALRALPELTGVPADAVRKQTVYVGQTTFATAEEESTLEHPLAENVACPEDPEAGSDCPEGARFNSGMRRQTFEPTPLGFAIQNDNGADRSSSPEYDVDRVAWEEAGGTIAGTSADSDPSNAQPVYDRVTLGELPLGEGQIRIAGALLPQPTEQFDHEFGLEPYAVTYTGYILICNLLDCEVGSRAADAGPTSPVDSDGDGVPDSQDACPTVAGSGPDGCPPNASSGDTGPCANRIDGTGKRDKLGGTKASDRIVGRQGNDRIKGRAGADCLLGKGGNDKIDGNGGGDSVRGGGGKDKIKTQGGRDVIRGGRKADTIKAGGGKDTVRAARGGRDVIDCGPGKDKAFINDNKDRTRRCEKVKLR